MTLRDRVWDAVLCELATEDAQFKISELDFDDSQRHTVRRVLREMENLSWLERTSDVGRIWYAGEKARRYVKLSEEAELLENES
ncbi:hypothetical protein SAMN04488063_1105 [Halopelagius inordinatus]|uniref:Uncharacterized protein n=1 Tax=Halopelagius inordinatus TaxID=553467 RepID=A0A1I2N9A7_9EURY|nr:hypothetical protein [Halopelagius inordinatus]SFG00505.1 hypothetical protein SAMN04488063_1105 [Halopelagius inordinatus]